MTKTNDPLLSTARALLALFIGLMIFAVVMIAIGVVAVLTVQRAEILADLADKGLPAGAFWVVVAGLVGVAVVMLLGLRFATELRLIVISVDEGDPFVIQNAERLHKMGWLTIALQVTYIPIGAAATYLGEVIEDSPFKVGVSSGGLTLIFVLFILARVFRMGAEMRAELEGTV